MDEWILITGANCEIGRNIVDKYLENKENLILTETKWEIEGLTNRIDELNSDINRCIRIFELDLEDSEKVLDFGDLIKEKYKVKTLINVAGINILKDFFSWDVKELRKVLEINFVGTTLLTKKVAEQMVLNEIEGSIIFISSQHGMVANYDRVPYCVSKGMLIQLTKALALELSSYGIRVNCISPTYVLTEKNSHILKSSSYINEELSNIPLGRYVRASDISSGIEFLNNSTMITGHNLIIDGGWTIK